MLTRSSAKFLLLPLSAVACVLATGCANMAGTATATSPAGNGSIAGTLHGGNQPISGSDIRLYSAGTTGYGSQGTLYAVTTSAADSTFGFTRTAGAGPTTTKVYGCPTDGTDPQMYITAKGGNTQGAGNGTNTAAVYIAAIGKCSTIANTYVTMNEVTTVGTMAALQQYFAPGNATTSNLNQLGYPATTQAAQGFANAVATIPNLVSLAGGNVNTGASQTATPAGINTSVTVTITPEINKIDTLANIIAACVNTTTATTGNCATLFTNATPPNSAVTSQPALSYGTATDTLQALYYMLTNPTNGSATNLNNLFALQNAQAPFQPMAATAPTDWTVALKYTSASACATGTANFLAYAYHLAVDATGNIWAVSNATGGNLFEVSPAGVPLTCNIGATVGKSTGMAIDTAGNVWVGGTASANLYKYSIAGSNYTTWPLPTGVNGTQSVAIDRSGDVIGSNYAGGTLFDFANGANTTTPATAITISSTVGTQPYFLGIDTANRIFATNSTTTNTFYDVYPATDANNVNGYDTANIGTATSVTNGYGSAAGLAGTIATANGNNAASTVSNTISIFTPTTTAGTVTTTFTSPQYSGGLVGPRELAIDGAGNLWTASSTAAGGNYVTGATTSGLYIINEFAQGGAALSPTGTASSTTTVTGGYQKDATVLPVPPRGIVIDPSGNVWVGSNASTGTSITELVGAGVPVVTPIAAALAAGVTTTNAVSKP